MSGQEFNDAFDEQCECCHDPLNSQVNWNIADVRANLLYCLKPECQAQKPAIIKNQMTGRAARKRRDIDSGLNPELKEQSRFLRIAPDKERVDEFTGYIEDARMLNAKGWPKYSIIFLTYKINDPPKGPTAAEMAVAQFPNEVDMNGCPSKTAVLRVKRYLKSLTLRYDGNLEIYSSLVINPKTNRREYRYHINKDRGDVDKQTGRMISIARHIELAAKKRENNFVKRTYDERMAKVELLDKFFEQ